MLDIKLLREKPDQVRERLRLRGGEDATKVDSVLMLDEQRRKALAEVEKLKADRNRVSKEIGALMGQKKLEEAEARKQEMRTVGDRITALDKQAAEAEAARDATLATLPNLPHASVAVGVNAADNPVVRTWGAPPEMPFKPKPHVELCEALKLVDFARGAKISGSGFLLYTNWGARLERALIQFLLDLHVTHHGYIEVSPPFIISRACMFGVGQFPKFEDQAYAVQEGLDQKSLGSLFLLPTAEAPVANIHREEILKESQLPIRYVAYSPCFRAEAGAAGVGTRGMIRVHQFDKVELIKIVKPEESYAELEQMVGNAEKVLQLLGLHYKVIQLCTGDMGFASAMTYDIEVWAPGQGTYLEVSSCSNCEDFQARRMNLRFKAESGDNRLPHILNGSGTALARLFVALIETHQLADGTIAIPEPLRPYLRADRIPAS
jgi:seryl-tRNA synthetase